jgi:hypothetical protein
MFLSHPFKKVPELYLEHKRDIQDDIHSRIPLWNAKVVEVGQHGRYEAGRKSVGEWDLRGIHRREMEPGGGRETTCRE